MYNSKKNTLMLWKTSSGSSAGRKSLIIENLLSGRKLDLTPETSVNMVNMKDCTKIFGWQLVEAFSPASSNVSLSVCVPLRSNISTTTRWIAVQFCTDIHGAQRMNLTYFGVPLTFHLLPSGQIIWSTTWKTNDISISLRCALCLLQCTKIKAC